MRRLQDYCRILDLADRHRLSAAVGGHASGRSTRAPTCSANRASAIPTRPRCCSTGCARRRARSPFSQASPMWRSPRRSGRRSISRPQPSSPTRSRSHCRSSPFTSSVCRSRSSCWCVLMAAALDLRRRIPGRARSAPLAAVPANAAAVQRAPPTRPVKKVKPRSRIRAAQDGRRPEADGQKLTAGRSDGRRKLVGLAISVG